MQTYANYTAAVRRRDRAPASASLPLTRRSPDAAYAAYMVAMSYYNQIPDVTRDQERDGEGARGASGSRAALAELRIRAGRQVQDPAWSRDQLAGKEMVIGRFYLAEAQLHRRRSTASATVISQYQTTNQIEEALAAPHRGLSGAGHRQRGADGGARCSGHNFPDSPWYKDTYALLQSKGLEPREDQGSWISKAFKSRRPGLTQPRPLVNRTCRHGADGAPSLDGCRPRWSRHSGRSRPLRGKPRGIAPCSSSSRSATSS